MPASNRTINVYTVRTNMSKDALLSIFQALTKVQVELNGPSWVDTLTNEVVDSYVFHGISNNEFAKLRRRISRHMKHAIKNFGAPATHG